VLIAVWMVSLSDVSGSTSCSRLPATAIDQSYPPEAK
jgi:hypothetical protein